MFAGLYVLLIASRFLPAEFKIRMVRGAAWWGITGLAGSLSAIIKSAHLLRGNMPPFLGTAGEADAIAGYLEVRTDRRPLAAIYGLQGVDLDKKVFDVRCGKCHPMGSTGDETRTLAGLAEENYRALLDNASEIGAGMPAVTCSESGRRALIEYFKTLKVGGGK